MSIKSQLESILFVAIKPLTPKDLANLVGAKADEVKAALEELSVDYKNSGRGLALISNNGQFQLTTSSENSTLVKDFLKDEVNGELSQPSLEALTIIAYRGPISKLELEKIRGVNCSLIIRNLLLRGLIEEKFNKTKNENYYAVTNDFIRFLGLSSLNDLPEYEKLNKLEALNQVEGELEKEVEQVIESNEPLFAKIEDSLEKDLANKFNENKAESLAEEAIEDKIEVEEIFSGDNSEINK